MRNASPVVADHLTASKAWVLMALIFIGSLVLALAVPYAALWGVSQLGRGKTESFYLGMMLCPLAVIGWAAVLGRLNVAYKQASGRRDDEVLGTALALAVISAFVLMIALIVAFGGHDPASSGPWSY